MSESSPRTFPELDHGAVDKLKSAHAPSSIHKLHSDIGTIYVKAPTAFIWKAMRAAPTPAESENIILLQCLVHPTADELRAAIAEHELPGVFSRLADQVATIGAGRQQIRAEKL